MEYSGQTKVGLAKLLPEKFQIDGKDYRYVSHSSNFSQDGLLVDELDYNGVQIGVFLLEFDKVYEIVHGKESPKERQIEPIPFVTQINPIKKDNSIEEILQLSPPPVPTSISNKTYQTDKLAKENEDYENNSKKSNQCKRQRMFSKAFSFNCRIRRTEYGITFIVCAFLLVILKVLLEEEELALLWFAYIPIYWFLLAQGSKRCHDMGQSGWYQIIPLYPFWLIFSKGEGGLQNKYGINPKI